MLFGGNPAGQTWAFGAGGWSQLANGPIEYLYNSMAQRGSEVVVFGGDLGDATKDAATSAPRPTWTFNGTS